MITFQLNNFILIFDILWCHYSMSRCEFIFCFVPKGVFIWWVIFWILEHSSLYCLQILFFFFYYFLYFPLLEPLIQPNWIYFQFIFHDMCILSCVYVFMFLLVSDMFWGSSSVPSTSLLFLLLLYTHFIVDFMLSKDFSKYFPRFLICSFGVFYVSFLFLSVL